MKKYKIGDSVKILGNISSIRKLGKIIFLDLLDEGKIFQIIIKKDLEKYNFNVQDLILVKGEINVRSSINKKIPYGNIEVVADEITIISKSNRPPIIVQDETDALEKKRMEYRYLDLRRPINQKIFRFRSSFNNVIRNYFINNDFVEIETPIITTPTFGGSGELIIKSRRFDNKYYTLIQSPQIYKQLIMYSGFKKYFQIAKCFRDEDSRSDRQLEFTQLDLETSSLSRNELFSLIQNLFFKIFQELLNVKLNTKFTVLNYFDSLKLYGTDKPDIRFKNFKMISLTNYKNSGKEYVVHGLRFPQTINVKKVFNDLKIHNSFWVIKKDKSIDLSSKNNFEDSLLNINDGSYLFFEGLKSNDFYRTLGDIRNKIIKNYEINKDKNSNDYEFVWIVKWPLFEINDGVVQSLHNPFSAPEDEEMLLDLFKYKNKLTEERINKVFSNSYDLVLNGSEIGGGSERINSSVLQEKVFQILGYSEKSVKNNFDWFLESMKFGIPKHRGIALGLDRILSIILNQNSIREVIAFPKTTHATDELMNGPKLTSKKI